MLDEIFFISETVVQAINTWIKPFSKEGPSKTVGENTELLMLQFMACSFRLSEVNKLKIEAAKYLIEGLTKFSV